MQKNIIFFIVGVIIASVFYGQLSISKEVIRQKKTKFFVETKPTDKNSSVMMLNHYRGLEDKVITVEAPTKIYDVAMTSYTKMFADRYGYPYNYVEDLSIGMQAITFEMKTIGSRNSCFLNLLIDEELQIDYPEDEYINPNPFTAIKLPEKRAELKDKKGWRGYFVTEDYRKHLMKYTNSISKYGVNASISTSNFDFKTQGSSTNGHSLFIHTTKTKFPETRYITIGVSCTALMQRLFTRPNLELWLKKKGEPDFGKSEPSSEDDFIVFKIPERIRVFAEEMMFDTNYNSAIQFTKDYYENEGDK